MVKADRITDLIGNTPVVRLNNMTKGNVWVKLEYFNPGGSVKDRIALNMIRKAQEAGLIRPGDTIVEPTSGNTGIGLALVSAALGYRLVLTMPQSMSDERKKLLKALGAELILIPPEEGVGMTGAIKRATRLAEEKGYFMPQQFNNPANPDIHELTTGPEIVRDFPEGLDFFVSGIGTGGTISGAGKILKQNFPDIKLIAVEPDTSAVISDGKAGPHDIQGIGAGFIPKVLDTDIIDEVHKISYDDAKRTSNDLARREGIFVGISSGAAASVAIRLAEANPKKKILAILPDTGERYLSTGLFG